MTNFQPPPVSGPITAGSDLQAGDAVGLSADGRAVRLITTVEMQDRFAQMLGYRDHKDFMGWDDGSEAV